MATRAKRTPPKKKAAVSRARSQVIAERILTVGRSDSTVHVRVEKPRKDRGTGDYVCRVSIEGALGAKQREAWGVDSMQALHNALQSIRAELAPHADELSWAGGQDGWLGFPKMIPDVFGPAFTTHLEALVDRETERFARAVEADSQRPRMKSEKRRKTRAQH